MRPGEPHRERRNHEEPHEHVEWHEPPTALEHLLVRHGLARPFAARLVWMKEGLVRLDRRDGVPLGCKCEKEPVLREAGKKQREEHGNAGTPEKLERLEAFERRIL